MICMQAHKLELQQQIAEKQAAAYALQAQHERLKVLQKSDGLAMDFQNNPEKSID